ncbi:MAG: hypothetical protein QF828_19355 [Pseudomonadales bacterium]|jgi:hypothetical protein|nr:hypothetical protein [Pseudomonadales bacterium]|tara:strand:+ start:325 stop:822 length:498 start_codon:yes stop_codon:yes gene_type:complete
MRILTVLFLPSSLIAAENGSPQPSQPAVDPANYVTTIASRLSKLNLKLGGEVQVRNEEIAAIPRRCSFAPARIKTVAEDLLDLFDGFAVGKNSDVELADRLLQKIDASAKQCKCYTGFMRAIGQNWVRFVNDLTALSGIKRPQSTWTCNIRDSALYKDRPFLWRM